MKKRITLILAAVFALALAICGSTAAFAAEEETATFDWYFGDEYYGDYWEYKLLGEAEVGKTVIPAETEGYELGYEFNVPESGYYLLSFCYSDFDWVGFPEYVEDGTAYSIGDYAIVTDDYNTEVLFYLEKGKTYVGADHYYSYEDSCFEIEYIGSEIKELSFGKGAFTDYLISCDINYCDEEYAFCTWEDLTVEFDSGKALKIKDCLLTYTAENDEILLGTNNITVSFLGFEKETVLTAWDADRFVSDVEMTNIDYYSSVVQYYDGYVVPEIYDEEVTVYFTDGTCTTVDFEYGYGVVKFPNGRRYEIYASYENLRSNEVELVFYVGYAEVASYECEIEATDSLENFKRLHESKIGIIKGTTGYIRRQYANYIYFSDTALEFAENLPDLVENCYNQSLWSVYDLICNDLAYINYVTLGEVLEW